MSTVTPRRADTLEESSERRESFCLSFEGETLVGRRIMNELRRELQLRNREKWRFGERLTVL